jgi:hypothetical protein
MKSCLKVAQESCDCNTSFNSSYNKQNIHDNDTELIKSCSKVAHDYECLICDYSTSKKSSYDKHLTTSKHIKLIESCSKVACYKCLICDYSTSKKSSYEKHLTTAKHIKLLKSCSKSCLDVSNCIYICDHCEKIYKSSVGLWKHKKICSQKNDKSDENNYDENININNNNNNNNSNTNLTNFNDTNVMNVILEVVKNNSDFQKQMFDFLKTHTVSNNTITNTNCMNNNKTFNLHFFLNETCKDAMNITDFVDSLQLQLSDLESVGKLGFVDCISNIIIRNLKALDENKRPIHCTDKKRETFYIKHDDKWEKEDENKSHIRKAIKHVANENTMLIPQWKAKYPDYMDSTSIYSDHYNNMVIEVLGGEDSCIVNEDNIIRKIAREVVIEK